jgi:predicted phage tail protein
MTDGFDELGLPPIGHNMPPATEPSPEATAALARSDQLIATVNKWLAERPQIADSEQAGAAQLLIDQLRVAALDLDTTAKADRKPYEDAIFLIRSRFAPHVERVDIGLRAMLGKMADWLQRERHRLADERAAKAKAAADAIEKAEQLRREAAQDGATVEQQQQADQAQRAAKASVKQANAVPDRPQVKGDYAKRAMSLRSNWKARVTDPAVALRHYAKHPAIREAALKAIVKVASDEARAVKGIGRPPPGCEFYNDETPT